MKSFLVAVACITIMWACKKTKNSNELVGKWQLTEILTPASPDWQPVTASTQVTFIFNNDYTFSLISAPGAMADPCYGTYKFDFNNLMIMDNRACPTSALDETKVTYTLTGNTLVFDYAIAPGSKSKYIKQ